MEMQEGTREALAQVCPTTANVGDRWYDTQNFRAFACTGINGTTPLWSPIGLADVSAIVVAIAILDTNSRKIVTQNQLAAAASALADFTEPAASQAANPPLMATTWENTINSTQPTFSSLTGLSPTAAGQVRIYQRYFYLNNYWVSFPMLNKLPASALEHRQGKRGVALIIVLAIVVILTGVIVAYFSRSIASRQIANSSANEEKVSLFAQAAANAIIGNLQQEIAEPALSSGTTITTGSVSSTIYIPKTAASILPLLSGGVGTTATSPNLLILSGTGYFDGAAATIPINAVSISSTTPSLNSRYVSPQRWNAHYLLPLTANATDSTPAQGSFTPPNWVLVARNGTNPTSWSNNMVASPGNTNAVVGRYAYAIYHEGGLLDANVAGFPIGTGSAAVIANASYKPAMSYADLTQIPGLSATASDALVGWRNDASAQTPGASFLAPNFTGTSGSNYYAFVSSDTTGFLRVSATNVNNNESDHRFGSRQELVRFIKNGLGLSGTSLNCLNYLATFTRDLNQPSLAPAPGRPTVLGTANGGNYELGSSSGIPGPGNDNLVNPIFLTVRVQTTIPGGRIDGSNLIQGEPLVKKRFSLRRLAWITYLGPSSGRSGTDITNLETNYGYAPAYLNQGPQLRFKNILASPGIPAVTGSTMCTPVVPASGVWMK